MKSRNYLKSHLKMLKVKMTWFKTVIFNGNEFDSENTIFN